MAKIKKGARPEQSGTDRMRVAAGWWDLERLGEPQQLRLVAGVFLLLTIALFADFIFSNGMLSGIDTIPSGIFFRGLYRDHVRSFFSMPMWDRYILGGLPFVDAMHGDTFYPAAILQFLLPLHRALGYKLILHVAIAGVGMYLFLQVFGLRRGAAFLGALGYMFAPSFVTFVFAGHDAKMYVTALLPFQFYFLERGLRERTYKPFLMLGGVTGLTVLSSHTQMAYFALWGVGLYFLYHLYILFKPLRGEVQDGAGNNAKGAGRLCLFFGGALVLALAIGAVQLLPAYTYVQKYSVRGAAEKTSFEHATQFSLHPEEIGSLVVPEFSGYRSKSADTYWGRNPFKLNSEYAGILPLVFAAIALILRRDRRVWFFLTGGILALAYAVTYHTPLFRLCYEIMPGVKNFRSQGMIAFLYAFCVCTLGAVGVQHVIESADKTSPDRLFRAIKSVAVVVFAGGVLGVVFTKSVLDVWVSLIYSDITKENQVLLDQVYPGIRAGIVICSGVALAGGGLAWARMRNQISNGALVLGIGVLILVDAWRIDRQFIQVVDPDQLPGFRTDSTITALQQRQAQEGPFRVLDLTGLHHPNELGAHRIETVSGRNGFHDNEIRWYRQFRGEEDANLLKGLSLSSDGQLIGVGQNAFLNLLNVRYVLYRLGDNVQLVENSACLDRAYVASSYEVLGNTSKIVDRLSIQTSGFGRTVLLEGDPKWGNLPPPEEGESGTIQSLEYKGDQVSLSVRMKRPGILVLCDNYLPYWGATDNGKAVPVVKAFSSLQALYLDQGDHKVLFTYISEPYQVGKWISILSTLLLLGTIQWKRVSSVLLKR